MSEKRFNPEEVADLSGLTVATIMHWIRKKKLKAHKVRGYVVVPENVRNFLVTQGATKRKTVD
jgi:predicted site-specific integrase-resolvase